MEDIEVAEMRVRHVQANLDTFMKVLDRAKTRFLPGNCISTPIQIEEENVKKEDDLLIDTPPLQMNNDVEEIAILPPNTKQTGNKIKTKGNNAKNIIVDLNAEVSNVKVNSNEKVNIKKNVIGQKRSSETTSSINLSNKRSKNDVDVSPPNPIINDNMKQVNQDHLTVTKPSESNEGNNPVNTTDVINTASCTNPTSTLLSSKQYRDELANKIYQIRSQQPSPKKFDINDGLCLALKEIMNIEIKRHPKNGYIESKKFKNHLISNVMKNIKDIKYASWNNMQIIVNEIYLLDREYQKQQLDKDNNNNIISERQRIQLINDATTLNRLDGIKENKISEIENAIINKTVKKMDNIFKQSDIQSKVIKIQKEIKKSSKIQEEYRERRKQLVTRALEVDNIVKQNVSAGSVRAKDKKIAGKVRDDNNEEVVINNSPIVLETKKITNTKTSVEISKNNKVTDVKVMVSILCYIL